MEWEIKGSGNEMRIVNIVAIVKMEGKGGNRIILIVYSL